MFDKKGVMMESLTPALLLGVSACCPEWQDLFDKAFFTASLAPNANLVEALQQQAVKNKLDKAPVWYQHPHTQRALDYADRPFVG